MNARRIALTALIVLAALPVAALDISNRYRSPRNPERKVRSSTELIVLHTTEAPAKSSLNKVSERGECHYVVTEQGGVYRIVDRDREAFHAGRSMWKGKEDCDKFSIGIECVGYHDKAMPAAQLAAIKELVAKLKEMYRLSDEKVICHSHVAYGAPNKWHKCKHRGRKRCGMLFAMPSVRARLGLKSKPGYDPDVRAGRVKNADSYLAGVLYGKTDTMRGKLAAPSAAAPATGGGLLKWLGINGKKNEAKKDKIEAKRTTQKTAAKTSAKPAKQAPPKSIAELKSRGYCQKGTVSKGQSASKIAGKAWNSPDTYYTIRNKVIPGNAIDAAHIEKGMGIWVRK